MLDKVTDSPFTYTAAVPLLFWITKWYQALASLYLGVEPSSAAEPPIFL